MSVRRGFTLLEVILALALLSLLLVAVLSFQWMLMDRRAALLARAEEAEGVGMLFQRLEADLLAATAGDGRGGAGVRGDSTGLSVHARGVWLTGPRASERREPDPAGEGSGGRGRGAARGVATTSDLMGTEIRWEAAGGRGGASEGGRLVLSRWLVEGGEPVSRGSTVLAEGVRGFGLRYFDGRDWSDAFDSLAAGGLPAAIEVSIWLGRGPGAGAVEGGASGLPRDPMVPGDAPTRVRVISVPDGGVRGLGERAAGASADDGEVVP